MNGKKQDLETVLNAGEQTIGAIVCWSLDGYDAPREAFAEALTAAWPDAAAAISRQPSPKAALSAAVGKVETGRSIGFLFRAIKTGFAVIREATAADGEKLEHKHVLSVFADDNGTRWTATDGTGEAVNEMATLTLRVDQYWHRKRTRIDSNELSGVLSELMSGTWKRPLLNAFSLRDRTGGVYFVPAATLPQLRAVKAAVEGVSTGCRIGILTVSGTNENLATAANDARASFGRQLAELKAEIEVFAAECTESGKKPDSRNLAVRAARFKSLSDRVGMFSAILGDVAAELKSNIEATATKLLDELEAL